MRVGLIRANARPMEAGTSRVAAELAALGHDVRIFECRGSGPADGDEVFTEKGYAVHRVAPPAPQGAAGRFVAQLAGVGRRLADRWSSGWIPDVVHGHYWLGGLAAATAARTSGLPMVQTFYSVGSAQRSLGKPDACLGERIAMERVLTRAADVAVAQSPDEADELTRLGAARASVALIPSGVDTTVFAPDGEAEARTGGMERILSVGLGPGHGQDHLIRALRYVPGAELVIVGGAGGENGRDVVRALGDLARRSRVEDRVRIVGEVPHERMARWYRSADVVACTPRTAPSGAVPVEAMACGVPVVGYALGGIAESVVDEVTGRLVKPGDVRAAGYALRELVGTKVQRTAYGDAAVDRARCRYTWERTASALEAVYQGLLTPQAATA
ncbi:glycosyltransferase involved in cell wall biosynthesis [Catenuloplanes nepalensis]|uniref:Glycosyltransferase involved in cell wall biosynthesis n=1 Tax=Catenuloplanes nepalensis TaxID=587533 RepID=A0ABT9N1N0_9ACTN|nr:glycosyltransferase [Catenuloplanes nepalensis]MDP9797607.1 glycosyltransferase involved in cell wall biosynthesis [Catenuloplanes nepalensis]